MEEHKIFIGQEFPDVKAFRNAIKEAAIAQHFELRVIKSDLIRYIAKCSIGDCPWRIRAVKISNSSKFTIRSLEPTHTCGCNAQNGHHQASIDWIERGLEAIYGSSEEGYCLLPSFCDQIKKSNPGTVAEVYTACADNQFQRLFVSYYASIYGFLNGCLPIVGLGGLQLKSKYLGTLLAATSFDADGGLFPLAFAVVDMDNDESWMWFLSELHKALEMITQSMPQFTFLSDGSKGIVDALNRKFPSSSHAVCMRHLTESIGKEFKNSRLVHLLWQAAYATSILTFKEKLAEIEDMSTEATK
uniref:Mutator-like transposase n=2 Tax=Chenopodium quinoa TaxID=63459 RepID=A0A803LMA0_CHEQI